MGYPFQVFIRHLFQIDSKWLCPQWTCNGQYKRVFAVQNIAAAVECTTYGHIVACINFFLPMCTWKKYVPQRSLKTVTSITLTTKQWISCIMIATSKFLSFFLSFSLAQCRTHTAILHWQRLMLRAGWFVQAWQNHAGEQQGHRRFFFPESRPVLLEISWFTLMPHSGWRCFFILIKNTVHELMLLRDAR